MGKESQSEPDFRMGDAVHDFSIGNGITIKSFQSEIAVMVYGSVFIFLVPVMVMDLIVQNADVKINKLSRRKLYLYGTKQRSST